jgi:hypothetical protein
MKSCQLYFQFILLLSLILCIFSYKYNHLHLHHQHPKRYDYKIYNNDINAMNAGIF